MGDNFVDAGDLSLVNGENPTEVAKYLLQRLESQDQPFTAINNSVLISLNPGRSIQCYTDEFANQYAEVGYKNFDESVQLPPHIFYIATRAYLHLRRMGEDQSFIFCGVTNSGKSENYKLVTNQLCRLAMNPKKPSKIDEQLANLTSVLESFGNAATVYNSHSSRHGKYQELQFNSRGRIIGVKTLTYYLEKPRVFSIPTGERSFHVFYQLLFGASDEERSKFHLNNSPSLQQFSYLINSGTNLITSRDDCANFGYLVESMKGVGLKSKARSKIFQLVATILHLGNLNFAKESGEDTSTIINQSVLEIVAELLGVHPQDLQNSLTNRTTMVGKEMCTVYLDVGQAVILRDSLAGSLYSLLFSWIVEAINSRFCEENPANFIAMMDQFGFQSYPTNYFEQFTINFANERIYYYTTNVLTSPQCGFRADLVADGIQLPSNDPPSFPTASLLLSGPDGESGLIRAINTYCGRSESRRSDENMLNSLSRTFGSEETFSTTSNAGGFKIHHFAGDVEYTIDDFVDINLDGISPDFVALFRNSDGSPACSNIFVTELFSSEAVQTQSHPQNQRAIVSAQQPTTPIRQPSRRHQKKPSETNEDGSKATTILSQVNSTLNDLFATLDVTRRWTILSVATFHQDTDSITPKLDLGLIEGQVSSFSIPLLSECLELDLSNNFTFEEFIERYETVMRPMNLDPQRSPKEQVEAFATISGWGAGSEYALGNSKIFLNEARWKDIEDSLRSSLRDEKSGGHLAPPGGFMGNDDTDSIYSGYGGGTLPAAGRLGGQSLDSVYGSVAPAMDAGYGHYGQTRGSPENTQDPSKDEKSEKEGFEMNEFKSTKVPQSVEKVKITPARKAWVRITWFLTWWIPTCCISRCGKMTRPDVQMAWREKVAICTLILFSWILVLFVNIGLGLILCYPTPGHQITELDKYLPDKKKVIGYMYGVEYDLTEFALRGHGGGGGQPKVSMDDFVDALLYSRNMTALFPIPIHTVCSGMKDTGARLPNLYNVEGAELNPRAVHKSGSAMMDPDSNQSDANWVRKVAIPKLKPFYRGEVLHNITFLEDQRNVGYGKYGVVENKVYDLSQYFDFLEDPFVNLMQGQEKEFLPSQVKEIFGQNIKKGQGIDHTDQMKKFLSANEYKETMKCLDGLFYIGVPDFNMEARCWLTNYLLIISSGIVIGVTLIKFLAALQLGGKRTPQDYDKFVICQVPAYTEGEDSIRRTLESLALTEYDDKHKLLFVISDGMIIGSGNEKPTPRIVCDVLGVDPELDPPAFSFKSVAEGSKQLNMGKVFSGLYECEGRQVPYIVVAKVGAPSEKSRPGNRGKRDSQIILMNFLNRVHSDSPMSPLELEMYHQLKNVIGVDPKFYEYILMVDADTDVLPDSMTRLVAVMTRDSSIMGLCGETRLANENDSMTTMIQVYEYYISHHLAKAFESLFGTVTCLPGCFSIYRIRTVQGKPLLIHNNIIEDYSVNIVDTLHKKNLLHLGEDRYLTTLMLKHFPQHKLKFTSDAKCQTIAPDRYEVLLSQRRRWINSTIHNLFELVFLDQMCGFCCFSMRFVVLLDLVGTIILPSTVIYLIYIIFAVSFDFQKISNTAIIMMCTTYILQALLFIIKQQWQHIGWMIFYLLGLPFFSFFLPIYSYWHFDDFSWGNTRVVVGDGVKQVITDDDVGFDPDSVPMMKWSEHESRQWEEGTQASYAPDPSQLFVGGFSSHGRASPSPSGMMAPPMAMPMPGSRSASPAPNFMPGSRMVSQYQPNPQAYPPPSVPYGMDPRASGYSQNPYPAGPGGGNPHWQSQQPSPYNTQKRY